MLVAAGDTVTSVLLVLCMRDIAGECGMPDRHSAAPICGILVGVAGWIGAGGIPVLRFVIHVPSSVDPSFTVRVRHGWPGVILSGSHFRM